MSSWCRARSRWAAAGRAPPPAGHRSAGSFAAIATVLITGATRGIGRAAAIELARRGHEVAIAGRDPERVRKAAAKARAAGDGAPVHQHVADLTRMDEVRRLADEVLATHPRLDVLANNAGAMFTRRRTTPDGFEQTFALNHLAPFLLTNLLLGRLAADGGGRVVTTASIAQEAGRVDLDDLQFERRRFIAMYVYGTTKLENVLFTRELARRAPAGVTATCFHPGMIRSGFARNDGPLWWLLATLGTPLMRGPRHGARSLVRLATSEEAVALNGAYLWGKKVYAPAAQALDDRLAYDLWERSAELVAEERPEL